MVTSLVLTGTYNIGISNDKIKTPDGVTINLKDVPFIRYRFSKYGDTEIDFIKQNMQKFNCLHIAEITVDEDTIDTIEAVRDISDKIGIMLSAACPYFVFHFPNIHSLISHNPYYIYI